MNDFKIGDIVIFTWKPNYGLWRKGKIVANNFAMCNFPDFFGKPVYYISEIDDDDNVIGYTLEACWSEDYDYKHNVFEDLVTSDITILNEMLYKMYETKSLIVPVSGTITIVPYWK